MNASVFSVKPEELSCLIGNLFVALEAPCNYERSEDLTICGTTTSGRYGRLVVKKELGVFYGPPEDLDHAKCDNCIEKRCQRGREGVPVRK